jgi:hypothetical protein
VALLTRGVHALLASTCSARREGALLELLKRLEAGPAEPAQGPLVDAWAGLRAAEVGWLAERVEQWAVEEVATRGSLAALSVLGSAFALLAQLLREIAIAHPAPSTAVQRGAHASGSCSFRNIWDQD